VRPKRTPAVEITVLNPVWDGPNPGSFKWLRAADEWSSQQTIVGMQYLCPCGCATLGEIRFARFGEPARSPTYKWNGNREYPSIEPTLFHIVAGKTHWSGRLEHGEWVGIVWSDDEECND